MKIKYTFTYKKKDRTFASVIGYEKEPTVVPQYYGTLMKPIK